VCRGPPLNRADRRGRFWGLRSRWRRWFVALNSSQAFSRGRGPKRGLHIAGVELVDGVENVAESLGLRQRREAETRLDCVLNGVLGEIELAVIVGSEESVSIVVLGDLVRASQAHEDGLLLYRDGRFGHDDFLTAGLRRVVDLISRSIA
jgi:hypothetical protein